ncbi:hypothetical protein QJV33_07640 [Commensalibacter sp. TBRC 10068]|uniref:Transposase n=1 Tax=Commensalibacter nepenthis TaxID=3043872 RepID=A0ABT6QA04_9PROT|nr:hypothetical protein [Commensalibacter sp. TBRC 10068]MDI2113145.1 hypothetical protein [Commensalibacter sp. TBRC 10068]
MIISSVRASLGMFDRIFAALAGQGSTPQRIMIDAPHLNSTSHSSEPF